METFIEFILDLAYDELYDQVDGNPRRFFLYGQCYEFAKILRSYVKGCKIVIDNSDHCGVLYMNKVYDAEGIAKDFSTFRILTQRELDYMEDFSGIPEKKYVGTFKNRRLISDFLIDEIACCNIDYMLQALNKEFDDELNNESYER